MKFIGNFVWFIFPGTILVFFNLLLGLLFCCTIVLIPVGVKFFKLANCFALPVGVNFQTNFKKCPIRNVLYNFFLFGFVNAILLIICASIFCATIVGFPLAKKACKLALVSLAPIGLDII